MASLTPAIATQNGTSPGAQISSQVRTRATAAPVATLKGAATGNEQRLLNNWGNIQAINLCRHAKSLRPFTKDEFGTGPAATGEGHIDTVNRFMDKFRTQLIEQARWVDAAAQAAQGSC